MEVDERTRLRIIGYRIDGKIAALQVVLKFVAEEHLVGTPRVGVLSLDAVRSYLNDLQSRVFAFGHDADRAEVVLVKCLRK